MRRSLGGLVVVVLAGLAFGEEAPTTPAAQYKALTAELMKEARSAKSQKDREAVLVKFGERYLDFAKKNAKADLAFDSLLWCLRLAGPEKLSPDSPAGKALAILEKDYVKDARITRAVSALAMRGDDSDLPLVKGVLAKSPDQLVQAKVVRAVLQGRENAVKLAERIEANKAVWEKARGEAYVKRMLDNVPKFKDQAKEYQKLLTTKYAGALPDLSVGKAAPEMVSRNLDGKEVKLSQYKGKVVVVDVWATWCPPCRAMIPHERELVKRLEDKPFVLISISADDEKETVVNFIKKEPMPWVHWWNGAEGVVVEDLDIHSFPTILVLDHKGVIRYKNVRGEEMDKAVEALLKEQADAKKVSSR